MTKMPLKTAFREKGLRAVYGGQPAKIVPVTTAMLDQLDVSGLKQPLESGQILVSWVDGDKRKGGILNGDAHNDLAVLVERTDGSDLTIDATDYRAAAVGVLEARVAARENAAMVAKENSDAREAYERAVARGETPEPVV